MSGGRPTLYKPENAEIARLSSMIGATNDTLAERFEVSPRTIDNWIATIQDFRDVVHKGRQAADESVVAALFARATGMERTVTKVFCYKGEPVMASYIERLPPDVRACIFWLRNRRPEQWRESRAAAEDGPDLDLIALEEAGRQAALAVDRERQPDAATLAAAEWLHVHL